MNYRTYRQYRDDYLAKNKPLRLDCMNPVKSMGFLLASSETDENPALASSVKSDEALISWGHAIGAEAWTSRALAGSGVRQLISAILRFERDRNPSLTIALPIDVYPVYWEIAKEVDVKTESFSTFPNVDLEILLDGRISLLVLPNPLVPAGRFLNFDEIGKILKWLKADSKRRVVIDGVYHFSSALHVTNVELLCTNQAYFTHSLSKSWLLPERLGVAILPPNTALATERPDLEFQAAIQRMTSQPQLPSELARTFSRNWDQLENLIRNVSPEWRRPETGYFSTVNLGFEELLRKHDIMSVPATVFGSPQKNVSVITCLFYGNGLIDWTANGKT